MMKKRSSYLVFGLLWLVLGLAALYLKEEIFWMDYGYLFMAVIYFGMYLYSRES